MFGGGVSDFLLFYLFWQSMASCFAADGVPIANEHSMAEKPAKLG
jgi:hypothetical protein